MVMAKMQVLASKRKHVTIDIEQAISQQRHQDSERDSHTTSHVL